ncbi:MAG: hypothetical protein U0892_04775 [Pirellulales bacterium]
MDEPVRILRTDDAEPARGGIVQYLKRRLLGSERVVSAPPDLESKRTGTMRVDSRQGVGGPAFREKKVSLSMSQAAGTADSIRADILQMPEPQAIPAERRREIVRRIVDDALDKPSVDRAEVFSDLKMIIDEEQDELVRRSALTGLSKLFVASVNPDVCSYLAAILSDKKRPETERIVAYRALRRTAIRPDALPNRSLTMNDLYLRVEAAHEQNRISNRVYADDFDLDKDIDWGWVRIFLPEVNAPSLPFSFS